MGNTLSSFQEFIGAQWFPIVLTLVLTVAAWKLNAVSANWLLVIAWVVVGGVAYRTFPTTQPLVLRALLTLFVDSLFGLFLYFALWTPVPTEKPLAQASDRPLPMFVAMESVGPVYEPAKGLEFATNKTPAFNVQFRNSGAVPVEHVIVNVSLSESAAPPDELIINHANDVELPGRIMPGGVAHHQVVGEKPLTEAEVKAFNIGQLKYYILSSVDYVDSTGNRQYDEYCHVFDPDAGHSKPYWPKDIIFKPIARRVQGRGSAGRSTLSRPQTAPGARTQTPVVMADVFLPEPKATYRQSDLEPNWKLPKVALSPTDRFWLELMAEEFNTGVRKPDYLLKRNHPSALPREFDPKRVDFRLLSQGKDITLLGLWTIDAKTPWLRREDVFLRYVKQLIEANPSVDTLSTDAIASKLGMTPREISSVISLAPHWAQASMGGNQMPDHYLTLFSSFSVGREEVFRFYESYMSLDKAIRDTFNEQTARGH